MSGSRAVAAVLALLTAVTAHSNHRSTCQEPTTPLANFDADKFLGEWYVIQSFDPDVTCLRFNYTSCGSGCLSVQEIKQINLLNKLGLSHVYETDGTLRTRGTVASEMTATFTTNPRSAIYSVLATDYDNYAAVYTCQNIGLKALSAYHRRDVYVLVRNLSQPLTPDQREQVSAAMVANMIEDESEDVPHDNCMSAKEADLDLNVTKIGQKVSAVASTVSDGISKFAASVAGIFSRKKEEPAAAGVSPLRKRRGAHY